ncbi:MAG: c-type cytochrome [Planctomycetaceae bacterium]|nr:c-type cytochrome [Planctomycetaceae bacterium]
MIRRNLFTLILLALACGTQLNAAELQLNKGDHICYIGNTLADRMQHDGWLETLLQARFPEHELVFRNLGFSGDELTLRLRSSNFGSPDSWLEKAKADVIFAFFGYNESHAGAAGLDKFKQDLADQIKQMQAQKYNGESAPRIVIFSPIAHEDLGDRNLPDGSENNSRLELYTAAMAEVAKANDVVFVDLFHPMQAEYKLSSEPLTVNGIHLTELGNQSLATIIDATLFADIPSGDRSSERQAKIRAAVLDKNFHWYQRYRTTDGYSIYGGRADLKFTDGQTNREVAQREMEILDVMTANRDKVIWAAAQGRELAVDDSNTPDFIPVISNKQGSGPNGTFEFLSGESAIGNMEVAKGMKINLFADEAMFPEMVNPVQMAFDTKGRLWVAVWESYPHWKPKDKMDDKLLILEDTNGDGRADVCKTFAGGLHNPTGFEFWGGGVLIATAPEIYFLKDTDGDDVADERTRVVSGIDSADTHHGSNSFVFDPGGGVYFQEGTFHQSQVETPWGPVRRCSNAGVFRYEPRTQKFDVHVTHGFANPHGHVFDYWGRDIIHDGTGAVPYDGALFSGHLEYPAKHARPPTVYQQRTRPCGGTEILSSAHFPDENQGNLLVSNVIGFQGILQYKLNDDGASFTGTEVEPIVYSSDPNFRPIDIEIAPDGSLYFTDWQNPIIGHMQHNLRDPNRDRTHGRVYRVTYPSRPLLTPPKIAGESIENLLELLKDKNNRVRYRAKLELSARDSDEVIAATKKWIASLDGADSDYEHHMMEALWVHQHHNVVDQALLVRMLQSPEPLARTAATRVLCHWRDSIPNTLALLNSLAADEYPRVRLEAVRAASFLTVPEAVEVPLIAGEEPTDIYLDYVRDETMKALDRYWKEAVASGARVPFTSQAGARFFLKNLSNDQLLKEERNRTVYIEMLYRPGLRDEHRREAVEGLAKLDNKSELRVVMDAIRSLDATQTSAEPDVVFDLVRQLTGRSAQELTAARSELEKLATSAKQPIFRQIGYVSLVSVDGDANNAWELAVGDTKRLQDFLAAMPLIPDASIRASLYDKVEPLLHGLPAALAASASKGTEGRYVRIELPKRGTLTLAEVEVYSGDQNVARRGRASQKNTASGGVAERAIDGNTDGVYGSGTLTHTEENTNNAYWEVDLGEMVPIERIAIYNRTEGSLGERLNDFTLKVLDDTRAEVFKSEGNPAPKKSVEFALEGGGPASTIRRAAMHALTFVRGKELETFQALAKFVKEDQDRIAAVRALQRLPRKTWPPEEAPALTEVLLDVIKKMPAADRTTPSAADTFEFVDALTRLLPADQAKITRAELGELGVRIVKIGTVLEKMSYDKESIALRAGKPVEFIFSNSDLMPHNFVITQPGAMEEIGLMAEATAQSPDAAKRQYVPNSGKILLKSNLLQPRDSQKISFTAPSTPGVYPYVCTYPGHWRRMYGALYVVEDLDSYLANPDEYLASHPLEIKDELLKFNRPRTEWKFEDLASAVATMEHGHSFGNAKQLFTVANCIACHKLNGVGTEIGPDLSKLDAKYKAVDILAEILEPSKQINEKFQTYLFELVSGKIVTGLILEENDDMVKIIENPLAKADPIVIKKSEIDIREKSPTSIMPKGLLEKLTRDEILDLIAYITARGNKDHMLFHGGHDH